MAIEQRMRTRTPSFDVVFGAVCFLWLSIFVSLCSGCATSPFPKSKLPATLASPYNAKGDVLWVVAPLENLSGTSAADSLAIADALTYQIQQVHGLSAVAVNRTIQTMRALGMQRVATRAHAIELARALDADSVVVGSITAWDPYNPPKIGLQLSLYSLTSATASGGTAYAAQHDMNPRALTSASSDKSLALPMSSSSRTIPSATANQHLDGANKELRNDIERYAQGRHDPGTALAWRRYLASMPLFTEYACHRLTERLLIAEHRRLEEIRSAAHDR